LNGRHDKRAASIAQGRIVRRLSLRVLVVQNYDNTALGQVGAALAEAGAEIDFRRAHHGEPLPANADAHDATVVLGGGQNALADEDYPYFPKLRELLRDFERQDRAVLGICLGSQIIARAFGGSNQIGGASEFGWHGIELTEPAAADAVLGALPKTFPIFQWHDDTFSLPDRAERLAKNAVADNQAFRIGRATYGIQFHFEADRPLLREWNVAFSDYIAERHPDWPGRFESEAECHGPQADAAGLAIARAWVKTVR
jgi:GMP synthase-like glutamine amidotransferase